MAEGDVVAENGDVTVYGVTADHGAAAPVPAASAEPVYDDGDVCLIVSNSDGHELISHQGFVSNEDAEAWAAQNRPGAVKVTAFPTADEALAAYDRLSKEA